MYTAVTRDIQVTVIPEFLPDRSEPGSDRYFWAYTIEIANLSRLRVQLVARHWRITDGNGRVEEVRGLGVVGEQPVLHPGESFHYTSGCPLTTSSGAMVGEYHMVDKASGERFDIAVPPFSLDLPDAPRTVN